MKGNTTNSKKGYVKKGKMRNCSSYTEPLYWVTQIKKMKINMEGSTTKTENKLTVNQKLLLFCVFFEHN